MFEGCSRTVRNGNQIGKLFFPVKSLEKERIASQIIANYLDIKVLRKAAKWRQYHQQEKESIFFQIKIHNYPNKNSGANLRILFVFEDMKRRTTSKILKKITGKNQIYA